MTEAGIAILGLALVGLVFWVFISACQQGLEGDGSGDGSNN